MDELEVKGAICLGERVILENVCFHVSVPEVARVNQARWSARFEVLDDEADMAFDDALISKKPLKMVLHNGTSGYFTRIRQEGRVIYIQSATLFD